MASVVASPPRPTGVGRPDDRGQKPGLDDFGEHHEALELDVVVCFVMVRPPPTAPALFVEACCVDTRGLGAIQRAVYQPFGARCRVNDVGRAHRVRNDVEGRRATSGSIFPIEGMNDVATRAGDPAVFVIEFDDRLPISVDQSIGECIGYLTEVTIGSTA